MRGKTIAYLMKSVFFKPLWVAVLILFAYGCTHRPIPAELLQTLKSELFSLKNQVARLEATLVETRASRSPVGTISQSIVQIAEAKKPSIVEISANLQYLRKDGGGFIYDRSGIILTHDHLLWIDLPDKKEGVKRYYAEVVDVTLYDGRQTRAKIIGIDPDTDLAAIKVDLENLPEPLELSERRVQQGELAFSIGHPLRLSYSLEWRPISAVYRHGRLPGTDVHQVDRGFFDGNSGGPLFDLEGKVIGLIYSTFNYRESRYKHPSDPERTVVYATIGWAIPAETISRVAPKLIDGEYTIDE